MPMGKLIIICGTSFSGKTTLASAIVEKFGHVEVDVDETKELLFGTAITDDEALTHADWVRIYDETDDIIAMVLRENRTVVDASRNFRRAERENARQLAQQNQAAVITIHVDTPEQLTRQRWQENKQSKTRRDMTDQQFTDVLNAWEEPSDDERPLIFTYDQDISDWLNKNARELGYPSAVSS